MNLLRKLVVTGCGTGYLPVAPGTWGSAAVCGLYLLAAAASDGTWYWPAAAMGAVVVLSSIGCVALGRWAEGHFGRKDPGAVTIDEWAGQALALLLLPSAGGWAAWLRAAGVGFVLFRTFDIFKPPPARQLERLPRGWGVLLDDLVAGAFANLLGQFLLRVLLR